MKFTLAASVFEKLARRVLQFAVKGRDVQEGYRLLHIEVTENGMLKMAAHDAGAGAKVMFKLKKFEPGVIVLAAEHLDKIIGLLPKEKKHDFNLISGDGPKVKISIGHVRMSLPRACVDDFPIMPKPPSEGWFEVSDNQLSEIIKRVLWSMCSDTSRPALSGVHLTHAYSETTDGHKMAYKSPGIMPDGKDVVVPGSAWEKLRSFVGNGDMNLKMVVEDGRRVWLRGREWAVYTALIADKFPDTSSLLFDDSGFHNVGDKKVVVHSISVNRLQTLAAVGRISGASLHEEKKVGAGVKIEMRDGSLHLVSNYPFDDVSNSIHVDEEINWAEGSVTEDDLSGFDALSNVAVFSTYMKHALNSLSSDTIRILWAQQTDGNFSPIQFHDDVFGMKALVMPRRL